MEAKTLYLYLTHGDSWGALSSKPPIVQRVMTTHRRECYPVPGEMVWLDHLCPEGMKGAFPDVPRPYEPKLYEIIVRPAIEDDMGVGGGI